MVELNPEKNSCIRRKYKIITLVRIPL